MPAWPSTFPEFPILRSTRIGSPLNAIIRSEMSVGPAKTRQRVTAAVRPLSLNHGPFTEAQVDEFETWHRDDIGMGALAFTISHPIHDTTTTVRFASAESQYTIQEAGRDHYTISMNLEILP